MTDLAILLIGSATAIGLASSALALGIRLNRKFRSERDADQLMMRSNTKWLLDEMNKQTMTVLMLEEAMLRLSQISNSAFHVTVAAQRFCVSLDDAGDEKASRDLQALEAAIKDFQRTARLQ